MFQGAGRAASAGKAAGSRAPVVDVRPAGTGAEAAVEVREGELARVGALSASLHPCPEKVADATRARDVVTVAIDGEPYGRWATQMTRAQLVAWCKAVIAAVG